MMGDVRGVRDASGNWSGNSSFTSAAVKVNNMAIIIDGGSDTLTLDAVGNCGRPPEKTGVWMVIVNNCADDAVPTLSGNAGNTTKVTNGTSDKYINITTFSSGDYRMYVKGGEAQPVFDGTTFKGFTLKSNNTGMVPKITYNYHRDSDNTMRKAVAYPTAGDDGVYDLSAYNCNSSNGWGYVSVVEFVPVVEALGASLRYVNDDANYNGIRFGVKFSQNFVTGAGTETANFGVILMAKSIYDEHEGAWTLEELKASEKARIATGRYCIDDPATQTYTVNAVLYNIPEANYDSDIIAIPYIGDTLYTAATRSMYQVALDCVNDANASAEAKAYCQTIVDSVTNAAN